MVSFLALRKFDKAVESCSQVRIRRDVLFLENLVKLYLIEKGVFLDFLDV